MLLICYITSKGLISNKLQGPPTPPQWGRQDDFRKQVCRNTGKHGVDVMSLDKVFQNLGPTAANDRYPTVSSRDGGTASSHEVDDRRRRLDRRSATQHSRSERYRGGRCSVGLIVEDQKPTKQQRKVGRKASQSSITIVQPRQHEEQEWNTDEMKLIVGCCKVAAKQQSNPQQGRNSPLNIGRMVSSDEVWLWDSRS